jgi:hypothetical protein
MLFEKVLATVAAGIVIAVLAAACFVDYLPLHWLAPCDHYGICHD